ncbi:MAG: hypothetical protein PF795_07465 [Kiritimatiellae bacterium]|jgi:uncharacterized YccA/Bax inhibitor family protein|nr:hypothetical protein [Kiritimatiellia bacterium]
MIALEIFFILVLIGLAAVALLQHYNNREHRAHKGDAVKTPEEVETHKTRN